MPPFTCNVSPVMYEAGSDDIKATHDRLTKLGVNISPVKDGRKPNTLVSTIKSHTCNITTLLIQHLYA